MPFKEVIRTERFKRGYKKASREIQVRMQKALIALEEDMSYPGLRVKIVDEDNRIWQARISDNWRFYFRVVDGICHLLEMRSHPK